MAFSIYIRPGIQWAVQPNSRVFYSISGQYLPPRWAIGLKRPISWGSGPFLNIIWPLFPLKKRPYRRSERPWIPPPLARALRGLNNRSSVKRSFRTIVSYDLKSMDFLMDTESVYRFFQDRKWEIPIKKSNDMKENPDNPNGLHA